MTLIIMPVRGKNNLEPFIPTYYLLALLFSFCLWNNRCSYHSTPYGKSVASELCSLHRAVTGSKVIDY